MVQLLVGVPPPLAVREYLPPEPINIRKSVVGSMA